MQVWWRLGFANSCIQISGSNSAQAGPSWAISLNLGACRGVLRCQRQWWSRATSCKIPFSGYPHLSQQRDSRTSSCDGKCFIFFEYWWKADNHHHSTQRGFRGQACLKMSNANDGWIPVLRASKERWRPCSCQNSFSNVWCNVMPKWRYWNEQDVHETRCETLHVHE